jgi:hypothetical protein
MRLLMLSFVCLGFLAGCGGGGSEASQNPTVQERPIAPTTGNGKEETPASADSV